MESFPISSDLRTPVAGSKRLRIVVCKPRLPIQAVNSFPLLCCEPLEMEYIDTVLCEHDVTLVDETGDRTDVVRVARETAADVVLLTGYIPYVDVIRSLAARLKTLRAPPLVFVGGPHAEVVPEHFADPAIDGVFYAGALQGIARVIRCIAGGKDFTDTPGVLFATPAGFRKNPGTHPDAASLPIPRRRMLEAHPRRYRFLHYAPCAMIKTSLGCAGGCTFCFCKEMNGGQVSPRPMAMVMDEIQTIATENIFIADDNFLASTSRAREFCRLIKERGISKRFIAYGTADRIAADPDLLRELRNAGLTGLIVGFEFVTDAALTSVGKSASMADNDAAVDICAAFDIDLFALFILNPDWPREEFRRVARYVRSRNIAFATFATLVALPGTVNRPDSGRAPSFPFWRYDLLRVLRPPLHMTRSEYYARLCRLSMAPRGTRRMYRSLAARVGCARAAETIFTSWRVAFQYVLKLMVWP